MRVETIKDAWLSYLGQVVPPSAGHVQVEETRRAFYAGAGALLGIQQRMADELSEDKAMERLTALAAELAQFVEKVR